MAPEADERDIFEDIRLGKTPAKQRARDPGLAAKHIDKFLNPSLWKTMDDGTSVGSHLNSLSSSSF